MNYFRSLLRGSTRIFADILSTPFYLIFKVIRCLLILSFLFASPLASAQTPSADAVLKPVLAKASEEGKKVLLIFHASWCGWCRKLEASLNAAEIKQLISRHYEVVYLAVHESPGKKNLENPGARELMEKFGGKEQGLPYWAVLDGTGNALFNSQLQPGKNAGCPANAEEVAYFLNVLQRTSTLTDAQRKQIGERFRKNEEQ